MLSLNGATKSNNKRVFGVNKEEILAFESLGALTPHKDFKFSKAELKSTV